MRPGAIDRVAADPRVASIEDERAHGTGWWVYLRPGFSNDAGAHVVHGTAAEVQHQLKYVTDCPDDCDCKGA